jgi:chromosome segregation ATPase
VARVDRRIAALERNLDAVIQAKNVAAQEKHAAEQERNTATQEKEDAIRERDIVIQERDAAIREKDAAIREKDAAIREKDAAIREKDAAIREKDAAIKEPLHLRQEIDRLEQQYNDLLELCDQRDIENKRILDYDAEVDRRRRAEIDELRGQLANSELDITNLRQDLEHAEEQAGILREDKSILSEDNLALMENISGLAAELELAERRRLTAEQIALSTLSLNVSLMVKQRVLASLILVVHGVADHRIRAVGTSLAQRTVQAEQHRHERDRAAMEVVELQGRLDDAQRVNRKCLGRLREHKRRSENLQAAAARRGCRPLQSAAGGSSHQLRSSAGNVRLPRRERHSVPARPAARSREVSNRQAEALANSLFYGGNRAPDTSCK